MCDAATFRHSRGSKASGVTLWQVIEFYIRGPVPKKVNPVPFEERGKLVEFPKEEFAAQSKTEDTPERGDVRPSTVIFFGCFLGHQ